MIHLVNRHALFLGLAGLLAAAATSLSGCASSTHADQHEQPLDSSRRIQYARSVKPIKLDREHLQTFTIKQQPLSEAQAASLGSRVLEYAPAGLARTPQAKNDGRIVYHNEQDASALLRVDTRSGDVFFNKGLAPFKGEESTPDLPAEGEAERMALAHLEKLGFLEGREQLVPAQVGGLMMGAHRSDGTTDLYKKLTTVRFDRTLAGLRVHGQSRLVVRMGSRGELVGVVKRWAPVEGSRVGPQAVLEDDQIQRALEKRLLAEAGDAKRIVVRQTELVLLDRGGQVIEPAIHVVASLTYEAPVVNSRTVGEVRRLDVPYDSFEPVLKKPQGHYPFMHNPEAARLIGTDKGRNTDMTKPSEPDDEP